jgi:hypothetical protein
MGLSIGISTMGDEVGTKQIDAVELSLGNHSFKCSSGVARFHAKQLLLAADFVDGIFESDDIKESVDKE